MGTLRIRDAELGGQNRHVLTTFSTCLSLSCKSKPSETLAARKVTVRWGLILQIAALRRFTLEEVERCFVHIDYQMRLHDDHDPEVPIDAKLYGGPRRSSPRAEGVGISKARQDIGGRAFLPFSDSPKRKARTRVERIACGLAIEIFLIAPCSRVPCHGRDGCFSPKEFQLLHDFGQLPTVAYSV
eukprot:s996_g2.t1